MTRFNAVLPKTMWGRGLLAAAVISLTAAAVVGGVYWLRDTSSDRGIDPSRVVQIVQKLPAGYESRSGQRVINQVTVDSFKTPKPGEVRPASCAKQQTEGILGETVYGVNAYGKGLFYVISAQQLPSGGGPHQDSAVDCSYMSVTFPDGYAITTPADVPQIAGLKVEATHTVSKRGGRVIDNYYYKTWLDGFHAVTLIVNSDPSVTPSSSPIDPALAKEIFTESVALVRGH
ncbi:DUF5642 family protein [Mycolicibacterium aubagnense]|uniref:DUF5642 family protein n=1 Tax=Mycolicibacterium aubagnense TaxID=319707 RepID=UPI0010FD20A2|nr:DUF5642 family protein [Mycolicibacterium aubagnense]WGI34403.1 DUF5642 family protein [Mycolicibacterium aubagnense]